MMELRTLEAEFKPKMHKALAFDGVDDYIAILKDLTSGLEAFTIIAWVYGKKQSNIVHAVSDKILLHFRGAGFYIVAEDGTASGYLEWDTLPPTNQWVMIGASWGSPSFSDGMMRLYINGKKQATERYFDGGRTGKVGSSTQFLIGKYFNDPHPWFNGMCGMFYFYNTVLSEGEVKYLYHNPFDPPCMEHLVLWLAPGSIDTANGKWWDLSGKNNHGTIYGCSEVLLTEPEVAVV